MDKFSFYLQILRLAPSRYSANGDFNDHLKTLLDTYVQLIDFLNPQDRCEKWDEIHDKIVFNCNTIIKTIDLYYMGLFSESYNCLKEALETVPRTRIHQRFPMYKMRHVENGCSPDHEGLFHISFSHRGKVPSNRFSAPGIPCLYMGLSAAICWEELKRPNIQNTYISMFQPQGHYGYINLNLPIFDSWHERNGIIFVHDLQQFPFIIASMVHVAHNEDNFKPEYIIPQLIMQWVIDKRKDDNDNKNLGVFYSSIYFDYTDLYPNISRYTNVAIPAICNGEKHYSKKLSELLPYTDPIRCDVVHTENTSIDDTYWQDVEHLLQGKEVNELLQ